jgi:type I restriction enzyme, S subunit
MKWPFVPIEVVCDPTGFVDPRREPGRLFRYVDISSIDRDRKTILSAPEILGEDAPSRARKEIRAGDVLVSSVRPNLNAVAIVPPELDGQVASTGFCVLRPNEGAVIGRYLFYYTLTKDFIAALSGKVRGAHYPAVSDVDIKSMKLPLPPPAEQRRIVDVLDQADALRKKRAEADAKAARILPSLFYKMFGDPATNSKGWAIVSLGEVIADTRNGLYKPMSHYGRGISILKMFNIRKGTLDLTRIDLIDIEEGEYETYALLPGDILLNRVNTPELVGKCAVITTAVGQAVFESKNIRIRLSPEKAHHEYVAAYLNSSFGHASLKTSVKHAIGMATINNADLRGARIPLPPLPLQGAWADVVQSHRAIQEKRAKSGNYISTFFSVLLHRAFAGDLTAKWGEAHMKELLVEMEIQAKTLEAVDRGVVRTGRDKRERSNEVPASTSDPPGRNVRKGMRV